MTTKLSTYSSRIGTNNRMFLLAFVDIFILYVYLELRKWNWVNFRESFETQSKSKTIVNWHFKGIQFESAETSSSKILSSKASLYFIHLKWIEWNYIIFESLSHLEFLESCVHCHFHLASRRRSLNRERQARNGISWRQWIALGRGRCWDYRNTYFEITKCSSTDEDYTCIWIMAHPVLFTCCSLLLLESTFSAHTPQKLHRDTN